MLAASSPPLGSVILMCERYIHLKPHCYFLTCKTRTASAALGLIFFATTRFVQEYARQTLISIRRSGMECLTARLTGLGGLTPAATRAQRGPIGWTTLAFIARPSAPRGGVLRQDNALK